jgi:energy-coupling factor transport system ATP-binding protein
MDYSVINVQLVIAIYRSIKLFGKLIESYRKRELYQRIGLVFQNPENQFITNTVWDELMFSLKRVRISEEEKVARVNSMLERFHLEEEKEKSPFILSQGQKRRLSVASMLLTNQEILFLDEPTYGQDFENRQELMKDMQKLVDKGITIVMITHDMSLVKQYATRVARIEDGEIVKCLPTKEFFETEKEASGSCLHI